MRVSPRRSQSGFTLLEVLLAIGISLTIGAVALTEMRRDNESKQAKAVGQQLASVGGALNTYIALYYDDIINLEESPGPGAGPADDPAPRYCTANVTTVDGNPTAICTITTDTLVRAGLLPRNFSGYNAYGAGYELFIRVIGSSPPTSIVDGLALTTEPYTTGAGNRYDLMGQAMQEAGADSGMTRTLSNTIEGLNGTWRDQDWPSITHASIAYGGVNELGLLGYRVGYGSSAYSAFLRRDGSLPMTWHLDMDDHSIRNVDGMLGNFVRLEGTGEKITLNSTNGTEATRTALVAGSSTLSIRNNNGVSIQKIDGTSGALATGSLNATGNITSNGDISAPTGNISAVDVLATGNMQTGGYINVGGNASVGGDLGVTGNTTIGGSLTAGNTTASQLNVGQYQVTASGLRRGTNPLWFYDTTALAWRVGGAGGNANIVADGNITSGGDVSAGNKVVAGGVVEVTGTYGTSSVVTLGTACATSTAAGKMRRATTGELAQCVNGSWSVMGVRTYTKDSPSIVAIAGSSVQGSVACNPGTTLVGGGYHQTAYSPDGGGTDSASPQSSFPYNNAWYVRTGQDNGSGTIFVARVVCAY